MRRCSITLPLISQWFVLLIFIMASTASQAGLLSTLGKIARKVDADVPKVKGSHWDDIQFAKLDMPNINADTHFIEVRHAKGKFILPETAINAPKNSALIISKANLPEQLGAIKSLPADMPLLLKWDNGKVFQLTRGNGITLVSQGTKTTVRSKAELQEAIWGLSKYITGHNTALLSASKGNAEKVLASLSQMRNQRVVLAFDDSLKATVSANKLRAIANTRGLSLTLIEAQKPEKLIAKVKQTLTKQAHTDITLADFYAMLTPKNSTAHLRVDLNGKLQTTITQSVKPSTSNEVKTALIKHLPIQLGQSAIKSIVSIMPQEAQQEELDSRWFDNVPAVYTNTFLFITIGSLALLFFSGEYMLRYWRRWLPFIADKPLYSRFPMNIGILFLRLFSMSFIGYIAFTHKVFDIAKAIAIFCFDVVMWPIRKFMR